MQAKGIEDLLAGLASLPDSVRGAVNNNGGGYLNHTIFWNNMSPNGGGTPTGDLATAIKEGLIGGAAIDVLAPEPPADDHPFFDLLERPNFILTPHIAWASREAMQTLADQLMDNIENGVRGVPSNVVGDF